jgi:hypothetical protein
MSKVLTLQTLIDKRACRAQVDLFRQTFGASVEITPALCESVAAQFDWTWASNNLLTPAARAEYERVRGPALAEGKRVQGAALAEYKRVQGPAYAECKRVTDAALAEYERVQGAAIAEYERVCARTFGQLFTGV